MNMKGSELWETAKSAFEKHLMEYIEYIWKEKKKCILWFVLLFHAFVFKRLIVVKNVFVLLCLTAVEVSAVKRNSAFKK